MDGSLIKVIKKHTPLAVKVGARKLQVQLKNRAGRYRCPVCNGRVSRFEPLPDFYLVNLKKYGWPFTVAEAETCNQTGYQCPHCYASDRDRLYALYLRSYLAGIGPEKKIDIVDFAPSVPLSNFIRKQISVSGRKVSYRTADAFAEGVDDKVDIADLHIYNDAQFDFFICSHVLEHVPDDRKALRELRRILKPGGKGILMVPIIISIDQIDEDPAVTDPGERWRRFGQDDHVRLYSKAGFVDRMRETGFTVHEYGRQFFGEQVFTRAAITDQSILYVVEK